MALLHVAQLVLHGEQILFEPLLAHLCRCLLHRKLHLQPMLVLLQSHDFCRLLIAFALYPSQLALDVFSRSHFSSSSSGGGGGWAHGAASTSASCMLGHVLRCPS